MLEAVDRRTIRGRRDYAILLLLATYGLRAHEVAKLTLDDVDWKRERLQVLARKAGHATVYPMAGVVAEAIIAYLKHGRPKTEDRHLFFRIYAPQVPITEQIFLKGVDNPMFHFVIDRTNLRSLVPNERHAAAATLRTANENITRVTPLIIMLTPTNVPIAQTELEGHCR